MNKEKTKRVIRINFDNSPEAEDRRLASNLCKIQDFPYDHTCSYDKLRNDLEPVEPSKAFVTKDQIDEAKKDVELCKEGTNKIVDLLGKFKPETKETWNEFMGQTINNAKRKFPDTSLVKAYNKYKEEVENWMKQHSKLPQSIAKAMLLEEYPEDGKVAEYDERPFGEKVFKEYTDRMLNTYIKKNSDYGSSFDELFDEYGMDSVLIRLKDKYNRLKSLTKPGQKQMVVDESMEDTLLDLANYCILTLVKIRKNKSQEKVSE